MYSMSPPAALRAVGMTMQMALQPLQPLQPLMHQLVVQITAAGADEGEDAERGPDCRTS